MSIRINDSIVIDANSDLSLSGNVVTFGTTLKIPTGNTLQRPGTPAPGMIRFNSSTGNLEGYNLFGWTALKSP